MARKASAKVVLNRQALTEFGTDFAQGLGEVARTIVETADAPDATPYGEGLVDRGGWLVYLDKNKIDGGGLDGKQPPKPRGFTPNDGVSAIGGFSFPAHFQELGTVKEPARPFLWPAVLAVEGQIPEIMKKSFKSWNKP
jgi:hypothetical protein